MGRIDRRQLDRPKSVQKHPGTTTFPECPNTKVAFPAAASFASSRDRPRRDIVPAFENGRA
jgi:hypothetical protein